MRTVLVLVALLAFALASFAGFGPTRQSLAAYSSLWSYTSSGQKVVAVANGGVLVNELGRTTFHGTASSTPLWQGPQPAVTAQRKVDAAGDTLATLQHEQTSPESLRYPIVRRYSPASGAPLWIHSFGFPVLNGATGLRVSKDGSRIVAWVFNYSTMRTVVVSLNAGSGQRIAEASVRTYGEPKMHALSDDGTRLLLVTGIIRARVNTTTGEISQGFNTEDIGGDCAISADGSRYAISRTSGHVDQWLEEAQLSPIAGPTPTSTCAEMRFGSELVIAWSDGLVQVGSLLFTVSAPVRDMELAPNGTAIAVVSDKLAIYERSGSSWPKVFEAVLANATDVDLSNELVSVVAGTRLELFRRGAPPALSIEYRVAIPAPLATPASTHVVPAYNVETGQPTGASITVRVQ